MKTAQEEAQAAADAIKSQIQELSADGHQVEYRMFRTEQWRPISPEDVRVDGVMLRIENEDCTTLCAPMQFGAAFRRVPKLAVVPG